MTKLQAIGIEWGIALIGVAIVLHLPHPFPSIILLILGSCVLLFLMWVFGYAVRCWVEEKYSE